MQGSLVQVIRRNAAALSQDKKASWLAKHLWDALMAIVRCESATHDSLYEQLDNDGKAFPRKVNLASRPLFLGEAMPERLLLDALDVFLAVKDVSMLGMLACVVELDRRGQSVVPQATCSCHLRDCDPKIKQTDVISLPHFQSGSMPNLSARGDSLALRVNRAHKTTLASDPAALSAPLTVFFAILPTDTPRLVAEAAVVVVVVVATLPTAPVAC